MLNPLNLKVIYTYTEICIYSYISWSHSIHPTYFDVMSQRFLSIFFLFILLNLVCRKCTVPRRYLIIIISHYLIPSFRSENLSTSHYHSFLVLLIILWNFVGSLVKILAKRFSSLFFWLQKFDLKCSFLFFYIFSLIFHD